MTVFGTGQMPEILIIEGEEHNMYSTPLKEWLMPKEKEGQEALRYARSFSVFHSGCWRGYQGRWKIDGDLLILTKITPQGIAQPTKDGEEHKFKGRSLFFPDWLPKSEKLPMKATWFSGTLRIPLGEELRYVHMGFGTIYEKDLFIELKEGKVVSKKTVNNKDTFDTSSEADLQWIALGGGRRADDLDWIDAREIPDLNQQEMNALFRTRGILYSERDGVQFFVTTETPTTESAQFRLSNLPKDPSVANGTHVEIKCSSKAPGGDPILWVESIRQLKPGESMHHPSFKPTAKRANKGRRAAASPPPAP